ncbi:GTPase RsgA, partial [Pseudomonas aeruginosa]|uniref:GTPase RsgA n=1 Tax=Pseudomonas aeruginosa TaxID=287 RepID=UPI001C60A51B
RRADMQCIGVSCAQVPRRYELCRPDMRVLLKPVVACVDCIVIVFAPRLEPNANLIDRYLIAAEHAGIQPLLLLNKADLVDESNADVIDALLNVYRILRYSLTAQTDVNGLAMDEMSGAMDRHGTDVSGQSGAGK